MTTPAQPPARGKKKTVTPTTVIIVLGVGLAAGAYLLWRRRNSAAAGQAATATAATPTGSLEDFAGQIATLQGEIGDLQSSAAQDEAAESGTGTPPAGGTGGGAAVLPAPAGLSVTPHAGGANAGWGPVAGASVYELLIAGATGPGTGTSHYDHVAAATHASVQLAPGRYVARVRAGKSAADVHGHWSANRDFTVPKSSPVKVPVGKGSGATGGGS